MSLNSENYPYAFYRDRVTTFQPSHKFRTTYFGGPSDTLITGLEHGPYPLHHILTLWVHDLGIEGYGFGFSIPLLYGICFDGCDLEYSRFSTHRLDVTKMSPTISSDDWPYPNYPAHLPYIPLEVKETRACLITEFSESVMQGIKNRSESELIVVIPTNPELRMSVWGPSGDAESVQIIFRHDTLTGVTTAYNACT